MMAKVSLPKWSFHNLEYVFLGLVFTADFFIIQVPNIFVRAILACLMIASLWIPYIRRFMLPALPIFAYLITFYTCQFISTDYRPNHIFVNLLPTLERILYGANLSEIISKHTHPVLDIFAWLPYGIGHFSLPFIFAFILFVLGPPGSVRIFGRAFGYMNLAGVLTQLFFPNASPWYELSYGSAPADYSIHGEPGGLSRIDTILGLDLYGSTFGNSPLVFGAFPSLHSGCATFEMLFLVYLCPRLKPLAIFYVLWMWFSTMYLTHHYMIDLVGGSIYAILTFVVAQKFLPQVNPDARTRLDYLGISKLSFVNFFKSIESDPYDIRAQKIDDEEALTKYTIPMSNRPEPLRLSALLIEKQQRDEECQSPALSTASASSSHYWSEPSSPITPHSPPVLNHFGNHKD